MTHLRLSSLALAGLLLCGACSGTVLVQPEAFGPEEPVRLDDGVFEVVTYNVAGLPGFVTDREPYHDHAFIGPKLAAYDLVLVQEDFWHHDILVAGVEQAWRAAPKDRFLLPGDGLARFSWFELGMVQHVPWCTSHGLFRYFNDRLASKGFSVGDVTLAPGRKVVVINVHADAGWHDGDVAARERQFGQLANHIAEHVPGEEALIVAGDFNTGPKALAALRAATRLRDAHEDLGAGGGIDRVLYRSGTKVKLSPVQAGRVSGFHRPDGGSLSDHSPVRVAFAVEFGETEADTEEARRASDGLR